MSETFKDCKDLNVLAKQYMCCGVKNFCSREDMSSFTTILVHTMNKNLIMSMHVKLAKQFLEQKFEMVKLNTARNIHV